MSAAEFVREATLARLAVDEHLALMRAELDAALQALADRAGRLEEVLRLHGLR